ncbi:MAG: hypothetical protein Q8P57_04180 [Candidatus Pacearchaeota archaeon]|nr:hypothetical protein [Candidatus Pacearchaeota archaeon]
MEKKCVLVVLLIFLFYTASAVSYTCTNPDKLRVDTDEINIANREKVGGLSIGVCSITSNSVYGWIESEVFIDSNKIIIEGTNSTVGTELISSNSSVNLVSASSDRAEIKIGSTTKEIDLGECELIGSTQIILAEISGTGQTSIVNALVGAQKIILNTNENPSEIVDFASKKYAVTLVSGSNNEAILKVNYCLEGELTEISSVSIPEPEAENQTNQTQNIENQTVQIQNPEDENPPENIGTFVEAPPERQGFFERLVEWFKGLFSN